MCSMKDVYQKARKQNKIAAVIAAIVHGFSVLLGLTGVFLVMFAASCLDSEGMAFVYAVEYTGLSGAALCLISFGGYKLYQRLSKKVEIQKKALRRYRRLAYSEKVSQRRYA